MLGRAIIFLNGNEVDRVSNTIVHSGITQQIELLTGKSTAYFSYMSIGTGSTATSSTQTALVSEVKTVATTNSVGTTFFSNDTAIFSAQFTFTSTSYSLREMGIFTASTGGIMLNRAGINVSVVAGNIVNILWQIVG